MTNPLARAIMANNLKEKRTEEKLYNEDYTQLIKDLIQGEKEVLEGSSLINKITLEEAADRVRKGI